jgi:hypothetical protein
MGRLSRLLDGVSNPFQAASAFEDADEQRIFGALLRREFVIWQDARWQLGSEPFAVDRDQIIPLQLLLKHMSEHGPRRHRESACASRQ